MSRVWRCAAGEQSWTLPCLMRTQRMRSTLNNSPAMDLWTAHFISDLLRHATGPERPGYFGVGRGVPVRRPWPSMTPVIGSGAVAAAMLAPTQIRMRAMGARASKGAMAACNGKGARSRGSGLHRRSTRLLHDHVSELDHQVMSVGVGTTPPSPTLASPTSPQHIRPALVTAHDCDNPVETAVVAGRFTRAGVAVNPPTLPVPSWPDELSPQHHTSPAVVVAHPVLLPIETDATFGTKAT